MKDNKEISSAMIKSKALEIGFNAVGISEAKAIEGYSEELAGWLSHGYHASMEYMERNKEKRCDPTILVPGAQSVISLLTSYYPKELQAENNPQIAKYAYGKDYHDVLKCKMEDLWNYIKKHYPELDGRMFVDSAPVNDRHWAISSGLGWMGKNGCVINKELGSFTFICELIINLPLEYDKPFEDNFCGNCTSCIDYCPTGAIVEPRVIDSNKCISFHTIESKCDSIPDSVASKITNQIFGCDICQDVCPWNKNPVKTKVDEFQPDPELFRLDLSAWKEMEPEDFSRIFKGSAVKRAKLKGLKRNLKYIRF